MKRSHAPDEPLPREFGDHLEGSGLADDGDVQRRVECTGRLGHDGNAVSRKADDRKVPASPMAQPAR